MIRRGVPARLALRLALASALVIARSASAAEPVTASEAAPPAAAGVPPTPPMAICPSGDQTACGREQFEAGGRAFEKGDFESARQAFENALALRPHPVIRYNLALCWLREGKPSAAVRELSLVLADSATDPDLRSRSERDLHAAEHNLAHVTFELSDPEHEVLEVDAAPVAAGVRELALDPGAHHVRIVSGASVLLDQDLDLATGERVELRVGERSRRIDVLVVPGAKPEPKPPVTPVTDHATRPLAPVWFIAGASATAVLAGLTVWSGINTQRSFDDYQRRLPSLSQSAADQLVSDGHGRELRTNLLLSGTLLCAAGTAALGIWFVDFGGHAKARVTLGTDRITLDTAF